MFRQVGIKAAKPHHLLDDDALLLDLPADFDFACGTWASKSAPPYAVLFAPFIVGGGRCADPPCPPSP